MHTKVQKTKATHSTKAAKSTGTAKVFPKLSTTTPGDSYEREADNMADLLVRHMHSPQHISTGLPKVARRPNGSGTGLAIDSGMENQLRSPRGGHGLPPSLQSPMEHGLQSDLSQVRLHTDEQAAQLSQAIHAKAFTYGNHIYFNSGQYQPQSTAGQHLIAHELTHVVQGGDFVGRENEDPDSRIRGKVNHKYKFKDELEYIYNKLNEKHITLSAKDKERLICVFTTKYDSEITSTLSNKCQIYKKPNIIITQILKDDIFLYRKSTSDNWFFRQPLQIKTTKIRQTKAILNKIRKQFSSTTLQQRKEIINLLYEYISEIYGIGNNETQTALNNFNKTIQIISKDIKEATRKVSSAHTTSHTEIYNFVQNKHKEIKKKNKELIEHEDKILVTYASILRNVRSKGICTYSWTKSGKIERDNITKRKSLIKELENRVENLKFRPIFILENTLLDYFYDNSYHPKFTVPKNLITASTWTTIAKIEILIATSIVGGIGSAPSQFIAYVAEAIVDASDNKTPPDKLFAKIVSNGGIDFIVSKITPVGKVAKVFTNTGQAVLKNIADNTTEGQNLLDLDTYKTIYTNIGEQALSSEIIKQIPILNKMPKNVHLGKIIIAAKKPILYTQTQYKQMHKQNKITTMLLNSLYTRIIDTYHNKTLHKKPHSQCSTHN